MGTLGELEWVGKYWIDRKTWNGEQESSPFFDEMETKGFAAVDCTETNGENDQEGVSPGMLHENMLWLIDLRAFCRSIGQQYLIWRACPPRILYQLETESLNMALRLTIGSYNSAKCATELRF